MDEMEKRRLARRKERRRREQRRRRIIFFTVVGILFIALVFFAVKTIKGKNTEPVTEENNVSETNVAESTETVVNDVLYPMPPETVSDLLKAVDKQDGIKTCYLTFDDGPTTSVTPRILDILRRYNVKATFFTVGSLLEANPDIARREYEEGHFLANHSYAHNYSKLYADSTAFMNEINATSALIKNIVGREDYPMVFRFPGGGYNAGSYGEAKQTYKTVLESNGIRYCDWNALNGDAEGGSPTAAQLVERVKKTTKGKEDVVILMHDAAAKKTTAEALPEVIEYLLAEGYTFKRLDKAPRA